MKMHVNYSKKVGELRKNFIFLFGDGVSLEKKMTENCIIARST
jgi:hypothetical protein